MRKAFFSTVLTCFLLAFPAVSGMGAVGDFTVIHEFDWSRNGRLPESSNVLVDGDTIYGMASKGGSWLNGGVLYSMETDGSEYSVIHTFKWPNGFRPLGSLVLSEGTLYGMASKGGKWWSDGGVIFSVGTDGSKYSELHKFYGYNGENPHGSLTLSGDTLYGMTIAGGDQDCGVIFSIGTDGDGFTLLHEFANGGDDGAYPFGDLTLSNTLTLSGDTLFGMTISGGDSGKGVVFSISTDGFGFSLLHEFEGGTEDGEYPYGSLTLYEDTLYGMTSGGGDASEGVIFSLATDGSGFDLLHEFTGGSDDGAVPYGSLTLSCTSLYGMTRYGGDLGCGVIFGIGLDGDDFTLLHNFVWSDGAFPNYGAPTISDYVLYGAALMGGSTYYSPLGVVFKLELGPDCCTIGLGDVNCDGILNRKDSTMEKPLLGEYSWDPGFVFNADLNGDGRIWYDDLVLLIRKIRSQSRRR